MASSHTKHPQNPPPRSQEEVEAKCVYAKQYEERQEFLKACQALAPYWEGIGILPITDGLEPQTAAELILRAGTLTGWRGSAEKIRGSQERAKDLITMAQGCFLELGDKYKVAECHIELSICYFRDGSNRDALLLLDEAESLIDEDHLELRLRILYNRGMLLKEEGRLDESIDIHKSAALLYEICPYKTLQCKFHDQYALTLRKLWERERKDDYIDEIIANYTASSILAEMVGNKRQAAFVENNLGFFLMKLERFDDAEKHLHEAARRFARIRDMSCVAQVNDTLADLYLLQGEVSRAVEYAHESVATFRQTQEHGLLLMSLLTSGKALARSGEQNKAVEVLREAHELGVQFEDYKGGGLALIILIEEISILTAEQRVAIYAEAAELLKDTNDELILNRLQALSDNVQMARNSKHKKNDSVEPFDYVWQGLTLEEAKLKLEEWMIRRAIERNGGNVSKAARELGHTPQNVHERINKVHTHLKNWKRTVHSTKEGDGRHVTGNPKVRSIEYYRRLREKHKSVETTLLQIDDEAFSDKGIHTGDVVIISSCSVVEENALAVGRYQSKNYLGYYRRQSYMVILETKVEGFSSWQFRYDEIDMLGCVVAKIKAKDLGNPKAPIYEID